MFIYKFENIYFGIPKSSIKTYKCWYPQLCSCYPHDSNFHMLSTCLTYSLWYPQFRLYLFRTYLGIPPMIYVKTYKCCIVYPFGNLYSLRKYPFRYFLLLSEVSLPIILISSGSIPSGCSYCFRKYPFR